MVHKPGPSNCTDKGRGRWSCVLSCIHGAKRISPNSNPPQRLLPFKSGKADSFGTEGPSEHWWGGFRQRHPELTLRKPDKLERSRAEALNPDVVKQYFELLNEVMEKNKLKTSPRQIYNCDETFVPLD